MIIHVQFVCSHIIPKKREQEWEEDEDLNGTPIGVICFNHALILANKGFKVRAEVGDEAEECPLCLHPELYLEDFPDLVGEWFKEDPKWFKPGMRLPTETSTEFQIRYMSDPSLFSTPEPHIKNPSQQDILGYDLDDLGWWKCRTCGKTYHPSRFQEHMKGCVPMTTDNDPNSSDHEEK